MQNSYSAPLSVSTTRFHALDAVRGTALVLGIVFHGLESLTFARYYGPVQDTQSSILLEIAYYFLHIFRMQAFFLMAGFFGHLLYYSRGPQDFLTNRMKRLVVPFLLFWLVDYLLVAALWVWNIHRMSGQSLAQAFAKLPPDYQWVKGVPLMHLWFLYYLILICLAVGFVRFAFTYWPTGLVKLQRTADQALTLLLNRWWGSLALGCLMLGPMLGMHDGFGVDTPSTSLWPVWPPFLLYLLYFALGWLLYRQPGLLDTLRRFKAVNLALSALFIGALFVLKLIYDLSNPTTSFWVLPVMNLLYAFASMVAVFTFVGYMLRWFSRPNPYIRYMSDTAYWGYLIHYPVVIFFQILVAPYHWPWLAKLALILGPTLLVLLVTYQLLVRTTWLGRLLNGRTYAPSLSLATG